MPRTTVHSAIASALRDAVRPLTVQEVFEAIVEGNLYQFRAKDPFNIVRNQLSRHCVENTHSCSATKKYFRTTDDGRFTLL
jgi:restriction system protein